MVNIPSPSDQPARAVGERGSSRSLSPVRYSRFRRSRHGEPRQPPADPKGLYELEMLAAKAVKVMEKHNPKSESNYTKVMDLLRLQYNMNFLVVCERCGGLHAQDELVAPER